MVHINFKELRFPLPSGAASPAAVGTLAYTPAKIPIQTSEQANSGSPFEIVDYKVSLPELPLKSIV